MFENEVDIWWKDMGALIARVAHDLPVIVLGDANIFPPEFITRSVGGIGCGQGGKYCKSMLDFLDQCGLFVPATFQDLFSDASGNATFVARGCRVQEDYAFVSHD
eukprot:3841428-Karenia_brevis.AAC.1